MAENWIAGIRRSIDYIEENLAGELDYGEIAKRCYASSYHFQRLFSILCGMTLGEYIRARRLTLAGAELAAGGTGAGRVKVIDLALKYGYDSPESFSRAFFRFHGVTPSMARRKGAMLRSFSRLSLKVIFEGGHFMNYRIENAKAKEFLGFGRRFTGTPGARAEQERDFFISTRAGQYLLQGVARDLDTQYGIMTHFDDAGYDYYIASLPSSRVMQPKNLELALTGLSEEDRAKIERIPVPEGLYLVCETGRTVYPTTLFEELRRQAVSEYLPGSGYELRDAPELAVIHWFFEEGNPARSRDRYIELWIPVEKKG